MIWFAIPLYVLGLIGAGLLGYRWRELAEGYKSLRNAVQALQKRQDKIAPVPKPDALLLDPDDIVQRAKYEHDQLIKGLNPK